MPWLHDRDSFILNDWILLKVVGRVKYYFYKESVIGEEMFEHYYKIAQFYKTVFNSMDVL